MKRIVTSIFSFKKLIKFPVSVRVTLLYYTKKTSRRDRKVYIVNQVSKYLVEADRQKICADLHSAVLHQCDLASEGHMIECSEC